MANILPKQDGEKGKAEAEATKKADDGEKKAREAYEQSADLDHIVVKYVDLNTGEIASVSEAGVKLMAPIKTIKGKHKAHTDDHGSEDEPDTETDGKLECKPFYGVFFEEFEHMAQPYPNPDLGYDTPKTLCRAQPSEGDSALSDMFVLLHSRAPKLEHADIHLSVRQLDRLATPIVPELKKEEDKDKSKQAVKGDGGDDDEGGAGKKKKKSGGQGGGGGFSFALGGSSTAAPADLDSIGKYGVDT